MTIARIENNEVVEFREIGLTDVPEHKRHLWREVVGDQPTDSLEYAGPAYQVTPTQVIRTWTPIAPTEASYESAVQLHVDAVAKVHNYANGVAAASYVSSSVPAWAAQAQAFVAWRDAVWVYVYEQLAAVQSQQRTQPTPTELVAELPVIQWPSA